MPSGGGASSSLSGSQSSLSPVRDIRASHPADAKASTQSKRFSIPTTKNDSLKEILGESYDAKLKQLYVEDGIQKDFILYHFDFISKLVHKVPVAQRHQAVEASIVLLRYLGEDLSNLLCDQLEERFPSSKDSPENVFSFLIDYNFLSIWQIKTLRSWAPEFNEIVSLRGNKPTTSLKDVFKDALQVELYFGDAVRHIPDLTEVEMVATSTGKKTVEHLVGVIHASLDDMGFERRDIQLLSGWHSVQEDKVRSHEIVVQFRKRVRAGDSLAKAAILGIFQMHGGDGAGLKSLGEYLDKKENAISFIDELNKDVPLDEIVKRILPKAA